MDEILVCSLDTVFFTNPCILFFLVNILVSTCTEKTCKGSQRLFLKRIIFFCTSGKSVTCKCRLVATQACLGKYNLTLALGGCQDMTWLSLNKKMDYTRQVIIIAFFSLWLHLSKRCKQAKIEVAVIRKNTTLKSCPTTSSFVLSPADHLDSKHLP